MRQWQTAIALARGRLNAAVGARHVGDRFPRLRDGGGGEGEHRVCGDKVGAHEGGLMMLGM